MAVKKTELYSSLWASCDALRGGMDASQYKDYILTLLFMKYVTDKYKGQKYGDLIVFDKANDPNPDPEKRTGCSFDDFIALKNKKNIGEGIDKIIARLAEVNEGLKGVIDIAHFNDETKIGKNKEMVDKLTKLISIFQRPELDFSKNKAEGDDIIGDAYEYLMRNFASESGKSKGQFYTPAEVSRILAKIIGIDKCSDHDATVCDPACGSGSLLIRALEEAPFEISGYGQEKDSSTAGLAKMNAVLHNKATIKIMAGNTFSDPQFKKAEDASELERFDYIVANPPFSLKNWADGLKEFGRFSGYGDRPPEKNGDYAWLMHILKTLKSTGKAAVILPHGVLFRGNAEATIRQKIIDKGWIKGIISLPPNLFYGTGIPACIIVIDKEGAKNRSGIFMIDASKGYIKEGSKNRLREQDIYRIVTTFNEKITTDPKYARFVLNKEIKGKNEYNLNISRYIDSSDSEDIQDIYAHIHGGIPIADIDALEHFWKVFPSLKDELFDVFSEGYYKLNVEEDVIRQTIYSNEEFIAYGEKIDEAFSNWRNYADAKLKNLRTDISTKDLIVKLAQSILREFEDLSLINKYDVYQILLAYWNEELSDDVSMIISDEAGYGAARKTENIMKETKKTDANGNPKLKVVGWEGKLIPKKLIISALFSEEKRAMDDLMEFVAETDSRLMSLIEESAENSAFSEVIEGGKVKSKEIRKKMNEIMSHVHTPLIDGLVKLQNMLPMKKKVELQN
jgi:type I restriction enzyme M protein